MSSGRDSVSLTARKPSARRRSSSNARRQSSASALGRRPRSRGRAQSSRSHGTEAAGDEIEEVQGKINAIEAHVAQVLNNLQKEGTTGINFTLESINAAYAASIAGLRKDLEALSNLRGGNEKAESQCNALAQLR